MTQDELKTLKNIEAIVNLIRKQQLEDKLKKVNHINQKSVSLKEHYIILEKTLSIIKDRINNIITQL